MKITNPILMETVNSSQQMLFQSLSSAPSNTNDSPDFQSLLSNTSIQFMPKCPLCDKTFANSSNLKHHMNTIHFNEAKWVCNECGKVCTSKSNLKVHLRVHLRVKPYYCRWCDYNCMHHSSIRDHLSKCHPEKSHNSCEPGYIFNSAAVPEPELSHFESKISKNIEFVEVPNNPLKGPITISSETSSTNEAMCSIPNELSELDHNKLNIFKLKQSKNFDKKKKLLKKHLRKNFLRIRDINSVNTLKQGADSFKSSVENDDLNGTQISDDHEDSESFSMNNMEEYEQTMNDGDDEAQDEQEDFEQNLSDPIENVENENKNNSSLDPHQLANNLLQQQSELLNSIFQNSTNNSSNLNLNTIAATLLQRLSTVAMVQQCNNGLLTTCKQENSANSNVLDLSIKTNEKKRAKSNENSSFCCSDESPVSPVSSISSSSSTTKTSKSSLSNFVNKCKKSCTTNKAISDVINKLNLSKESQIEEEEEKLNSSASTQQQTCSSGYKCTYCNIVFDEYPLYSIHAGMHSNLNPWKCNVCGHVCMDKMDFAVHILHLAKL